MRQIVLDTETTGLSPKNGDRIVEIGCVELLDRKLTGSTYHQYINPERDMPEQAFNVHGLSNEFLSDKPVFSKIFEQFIDYIKDAELVIHNAPFDVGFINNEISLLGSSNTYKIQKIENCCTVFDTLKLAKNQRPGQKNNLDALCRNYGIDNSNRDLHGALLDSEILADVFLAMTGGQTDLVFSGDTRGSQSKEDIIKVTKKNDPIIILANDRELAAHNDFLTLIQKKAGKCLWDKTVEL